MRAYNIAKREEKINKINAQLCDFIKLQTLPSKGSDTKYLNVDDVSSLYFIEFQLYRINH